jgi:hypothetical protein
MDKKSTTWGMNPDKIIHLFEACSDTSQADQKADMYEKKAILLQDWLAQTLSSAPSPSGELSRDQSKLTNTIWALASAPVRELLQDPKTEIAIIRKIKNYGKKLSRHFKSEAEHHVANTIYYAAIAHGLVFSNLRITNFSYKELLKSFCRLSNEAWIPKGLLALFTKASEYCETKGK